MSPHPRESPQTVYEHNRRVWDARVRQQLTFTKPVEDDDFSDPLGTVDGPGWLGGDIRGCMVLCLASGGGRQAPLYAAAGAHVTVVDISPAMLELDRSVAAARGFEINTVETSMDNLTAFDDATFDIVIQPVSTCYVPHILPVYKEVARVAKPRGLYISQHKQPTSLQADTERTSRGYELTELYYGDDPLPQVVGSPHREEGTLEFLHRWEELIGGMCRAGFVIEDLLEPRHARSDAPAGSFADRCRYVPPYVRVKARRIGSTNQPLVWTPV